MMRMVLKVLMGACFVFLGIAAVSFLQSKFDEGDLKKAVRAIQAKFPEATDCHAQVTSRFWGKVQVRCREGAWQVDVVRGFIEPL